MHQEEMEVAVATAVSRGHSADDPPAVAPAGEEPTPLYRQVASALRTAIVRGHYPIGSRVPTEIELCRFYNVSRYTIREALRQLRAEGLVVSRPGFRPTVALPSSEGVSALFDGEVGADFFDYMIGTRLVIQSAGIVAISPGKSAETGLPEGEQWLLVSGFRTRVGDKKPTCWHEYLIHIRFATVERLLGRHVGPVLPLIEDLFGERIVQLTRSVSAIGIASAQAAVLGVATGSPALNIVTRCETDDGLVAMLNRSIHTSGTISHTIRRDIAR